MCVYECHSQSKDNHFLGLRLQLPTKQSNLGHFRFLEKSVSFWTPQSLQEYHEGNVEECIEAIHLLGSTPLNDPDFQGYLDAHTIDKLPPAFQKILECSSPTTPQLLSR